MEGFDPQMMMQFSQALQRLPKGQLQRLQGMMQRAMSGKDVTAEAQEFERSLPPDFQQMIQSFQGPALQEMAEAQLPMTETSTSEMTEEQARALVAKAASEGAISQEQAQSLLDQPAESIVPSMLESESSSDDASSKFGKFWRNLAGKK
jgi:cell wall assembly regulator SMI1